MTAKPRILVVEDSKEIQTAEQSLFQSVGAEVTAVGTGEEAVALIKDSVANGPLFNLIILDIRLPQMDGYQVAREMRTCGYRGLIAVFTANPTLEGKQEGRDAGIDLYFSKDVLRQSLAQALLDSCKAAL